MFDKTFNETKMAAWKSFRQVCLNFLGLHRSDDFKDVVANLLRNYHKIGCKISPRIHFLHSHLPFFHENLGAVSDEDSEKFHQNIAVIEKRFKGKWSSGMLAEYCRSLKRDQPGGDVEPLFSFSTQSDFLAECLCCSILKLHFFHIR